MPTITDWLMVAITAVYVVATIFICYANLSSAKATREQVAESKRQFEETRRLEIMPYLQFESYTGSIQREFKKERLVLATEDFSGATIQITFAIKNVGRGAAREITWIWKNFNNSFDKGNFPIRAVQNGEKQFLIFSFGVPKNTYDVNIARVELNFKDLLDNAYTQIVEFRFKYSVDGLHWGGYDITPPSKK